MAGAVTSASRGGAGAELSLGAVVVGVELEPVPLPVPVEPEPPPPPGDGGTGPGHAKGSPAAAAMRYTVSPAATYTQPCASTPNEVRVYGLARSRPAGCGPTPGFVRSSVRR